MNTTSTCRILKNFNSWTNSKITKGKKHSRHPKEKRKPKAKDLLEK